MSKIILILLFAITLPAAIGAVVYTQYSSANPKLPINISSITAQSQSSVIVSSLPMESVSTASSSLQSQNTVLDNPIQDVPTVTKLSTDKSIYHQYILDYLACPTKFYQPLNGGYIYEGLDQYQYKCIPQAEADKCPSKSLIFGFPPIVGSQVALYAQDKDGSVIPSLDKLYSVELNKYYCALFHESIGSVSISEVSSYGWRYLPDQYEDKFPEYFVIPKTNLSSKAQFDQEKTTFSAIPLSSFSEADQEYISTHFKNK